mmetsp:Transcript_34781/g.63317  ORF Transcript_34781/g.63317 Transcript_34781/m.63317 type:complete len:230 (+) Transcript_34781:1070-1759(+)
MSSCGLLPESTLHHDFLDEGVSACLFTELVQGVCVQGLQLLLPGVMGLLGPSFVNSTVLLPLGKKLLHTCSLCQRPRDADVLAKSRQLGQRHLLQLLLLCNHDCSDLCLLRQCISTNLFLVLDDSLDHVFLFAKREPGACDKCLDVIDRLRLQLLPPCVLELSLVNKLHGLACLFSLLGLFALNGDLLFLGLGLERLDFEEGACRGHCLTLLDRHDVQIRVGSLLTRQT